MVVWLYGGGGGMDDFGVVAGGGVVFGALAMGLVGARDDIDIFGTSEFINIVELELV